MFNQNINNMTIYSNLVQAISEQLKEIKPILTDVMPYMVAGTVFWGLSEQALLLPAETVAYAASKVLDSGMILSLSFGALNVIKIANPDWMSFKKVVPLVATQEQIDLLNAEIVRLKQELEKKQVAT